MDTTTTTTTTTTNNNNNNQIVIPGEIIGTIKDYNLGIGVYEYNKNIISSLVGNVLIEYINDNNKIIHVIIPSKLSNPIDNVININDILLCKITKVTTNQVYTDIISNGDKELRIHAKGIIRRGDVRINEIDKIIMHECFHPGDLVRAIVISLGDSKYYYLSTAENNLGVIYSKSESNNNLIPVNNNEMKDCITGHIENRKVAYT